MKRIKQPFFQFVCCIIFICITCDLVKSQEIPQISHYSFVPGEMISYRMNYSIFTVGKAEILISPVMYRVSEKKYYRIDVNGRTVGAAQLVSTVNDNWGALLDTIDLLPLRSWRNIEEGKYRRREYVDYDHTGRKLKVRVFDNSTGTYSAPKEYKFSYSRIRDLLSGYLFLRIIDYNSLHIGDTINVSGFLEDTFYNLNILYEGKEEIETKLGNILAYKLVPVMPDNQLFAGENSITAWFSADRFQIPLKIEAKMFIGHVGCEIIGLQGTKGYPDFRDD
jgi:hypothetical protein